MLSENAQKLVDALRSGDYEQGRHALTIRFPNGAERDCCLGVACKVAIADGVAVDMQTRASSQDVMVLYDGDGSMLPKSVQEWLGFSYATGGYIGGSLLSDNDFGKKTFAEIADIIETVPDLFTDAV